MLAPDALPARYPGGTRYRVALASDLSRVGEVVDLVCHCSFGEALPSARTRFRLSTVVAEAVANAMLYGNDNDPGRQVTVEVEIIEDRVVVAVSDEGNGFNHRVVALPVGEESIEATRGRGLFMIHRLADLVEFNDRGNTIWMTLPRR